MILQDFATSMPLVSIIVFSFFITLALTFAYKLLTKQEDLKKLKERTKQLQEEMKTEKDQNKIMELQKEMLSLSAEQMKHSMKPMLFTFLPLIAVFAGLKSLYASTGDIIPWGSDIPVFHTGAGWLLCYIIFSMIFSITLRKILKIH
jgi:uncharacterized membrane protein (DUF106 family)